MLFDAGALQATEREVIMTSQNPWTSCVIDEGGPLRSAFRSRSQTTSKLLRSKAVGSVRWRKSAKENLRRLRIRETNESEPLRTRVNNSSVVKTRGATFSWDEPAGCLMTEQVATGV